MAYSFPTASVRADTLLLTQYQLRLERDFAECPLVASIAPNVEAAFEIGIAPFSSDMPDLVFTDTFRALRTDVISTLESELGNNTNAT
jgi:hypothetical protein